MKPDDALDRLAEVCGIKPDYTDAHGRQYVVSPDTKRALLHALGLDASSHEAIRAALHGIDREAWQRPIPPASVLAHKGGPVVVRGEDVGDDRIVAWTIDEGSETARRGACRWTDLPLLAHETHDGHTRESRALGIAAELACGHHALGIDLEGRRTEGRLIIAPGTCFFPDVANGRLPWGMAVQLYGLRSRRNWGVGDFGDLAEAADIFSALGADTVSISPVHALFPADPGHFGPYGPSSRLFLNVMHIDVESAPGFDSSEDARALRSTVSDIVSHARSAALVDYRAVAEAKMAVLGCLWAWLAHSPDHQSRAAFEQFKAEQGQALFDQAVFDALHEHFFKSASPEWNWRKWPAGYRDPRTAEVAEFARLHADRVGFFMYLQWLADCQLGEAHARARAAGMTFGIFRDLAVGTDTSGAMAWIYPDLMLNDAAIGAPPDAFNHLGQNWGITGLSPRGLVSSGFAPFVAMLRANMRHAGALRVDHVMGLERLFVIPAGAQAREGAYVTYPADELRLLLSLESQSQRCAIVGEDLGTVPPGLRERLGQAGVLTYKVVYFEREADGSFTDPARYMENCLVSASTHDLPPLAGFWGGHDIEWRRRIGELADDNAYASALADRARDKSRLLDLLVRCGEIPPGTDPGTVGIGRMVEALYGTLAKAPSRMLMVLAEDLLLLSEQPNLPGTYDEHPNWRRKLSVDLEALSSQPSVVAIAAAVRRGRARR